MTANRQLIIKPLGLAAVYCIIVGIVTLYGYLSNTDGLLSILPGYATTKPTTALCFLLTGIGLYINGAGNVVMQAIRKLCAASVAIIGLSALYLYISVSPLGWLDTLPFISVEVQGRMSPMTAACFAVLGLTGLSLSKGLVTTGWRPVTLSLMLTVFSFIATVADSLHGDYAMSLPTVTGFMVIAISLYRVSVILNDRYEQEHLS